MLEINQKQNYKIKQMEKKLAELEQQSADSNSVQVQKQLDYGLRNSCSMALSHLKRKSLPTIYESESPVKRRSGSNME